MTKIQELERRIELKLQFITLLRHEVDEMNWELKTANEIEKFKKSRELKGEIDAV